MNLSEYIGTQISWSLRTFGPGSRTEGVVKHIKKELEEVLAKPDDLEEWADVIILGIDGAWRTGATADDIVQILHAKQKKNIGRKWPDWRTFPSNEPIEHVRD
jgi:hypothetical protein